MYGARFAVFVRPARVLPSPSQATRNLSFLEVSAAPVTLVVSSCCYTGLVRVGLNSPLNGNRANVYAHVPMCREHVWRTVCSVFKTSARVAHPFPFVVSLRFQRRPITLLFQLVVSVVWYGLA